MTVDDEGDLVTQLKRVESDLTFRRRTRRRVIAIAIVVAFDLVISFLSVAAFLGVRHQQDKDDADVLSRRTADCHSMDDVGSAVKAVKAGLTVLPADPRTSEFIAAYNTAVDAAVDAAVITAKTRKGYSADCTQIGTPPKPGG